MYNPYLQGQQPIQQNPQMEQQYIEQIRQQRFSQFMQSPEGIEAQKVLEERYKTWELANFNPPKDKLEVDKSLGDITKSLTSVADSLTAVNDRLDKLEKGKNEKSFNKN